MTSGLEPDDLPSLFRDADAASDNAQRRFFRATAAAIGASVTAAAFGAFGSDWTGYPAALAFVGALAASYFLLKENPERLWYDGRAAAESAKTLGWQFAVGGGDFGRSKLTDDEAAMRLVDAFAAVRSGLGDVAPVPQGPVEQVTGAMRILRESDLETRRANYRTGRIDDQCDWYSKRSTMNDRRRKQWGVASAGFQAVGLLAGLAKGAGWLDFDLMGIAATAGVGAAGWLRTKDHADLARAYAVAAQDLAGAKIRLDAATSEDEWAQAVHDAETAISREHIGWAARRHLQAAVR